MQIAIFGGTDESGFPPEWSDETVVALVGGVTLDLTKRRPAPDATLTLIGAIGGARIVVPVGVRLAVEGVSLLGGRSVRVRSGGGPNLRIRAFLLLGGLSVIEGAPEPGDTATASGAGERATFPDTGE